MLHLFKDILFNKIPHPSIVILKYPLLDNERQEITQELQKSKFKIDSVSDYLANPNLHKFIYNSENIQLQIIAENFEPTMVRKFIRRAAALLHFTNSTKPFKVIWVPCPEKRTLPQKGEIIKPNHINGGYTYMNGDVIYIYRYEEFAKVLLHEILHHTYFDIGRLPWPDKELREVFNIAPETPLIPNEAVIETWAELFQMIFLSIETDIPLERLIQIEANHALCQSAKILSHKKNKSEPWREETNAFSYIVFRAIFMCNLPEFIIANRDPIVYTRILVDTWRSLEFQELLAGATPEGCDLKMSAFNNF